jgi:hypothetical protein
MSSPDQAGHDGKSNVFALGIIHRGDYKALHP